MIHRTITLTKSNSFFLFGARGTGKSTLLRQFFSPNEVCIFDLLDPDLEEQLSRRPNEFKDRLALLPAGIQWVILDEVQKIPKLLDIVHSQIELGRFKFAMTGSSARKLKRGAANLLAGRAFIFSLFPLTHVEMGEAFNLKSALEWGTLPKIGQFTTSEDRSFFLKAYAQTYLKEEIQAEQIVRKLGPFRQFLEVASQMNGQILNYSNIARDIGADTKTVQSYFKILEDTLVGTLLEPFHQSIRKRQNQNPKFYFFDAGIKRALDRTLTQELLPQTSVFGKAFDHFVINEALRLNEYRQKDYRFSYIRTKDDAEIDLVIERPGMPTALVEIKSKSSIDERDIRNLEKFRKDLKNSEAFCWSLDLNSKKIGNVSALPWQRGLAEVGLD